MKKIECWGIFREITHSPHRESDDENILRLTTKKLENQGAKVSLFWPDEISNDKTTRPDLVFLMCETLPILDTLKTWEQQGVMMINSIEAILNTYRHRTVEILSGVHAFFPASVLIETTDSLIKQKIEPSWVKRGDVHATQEGDVALVRNSEELKQCLKQLGNRGIKKALLQKHIEGDLIKFYGIGTEKENWFHSFYHKDQVLKKYPFDREGLKNYARTGARVLGLEIFGGDAIVDSSGRIFIIDLNAWPSFALVRDKASTHISNYIISKIQNKLRKSQLTTVER